MKNSTIFFGIFLSIFIIQSVYSWQGMPIRALRVDGRNLKDANGNIVVLRGGWMQPLDAYFNGNRYTNPTNWTDPNNVAPMLNFLKEAADVMSNTSPRYGRNHGWYCTFVRINTDMIGGWSHDRGLYDQNQFNGWINNFLVPYANHLRSRGLYLVICATGPINTPNNGTRNCGQIEQQRLRTFWKTVANANGIKNADNVMFELMNEPVEIESSPGNGDWGFGQDKYFLAFRNWIQPVIDDIRSTGANNIIWVPTLEWQGSPYQHARYPFSGTNCGIAAHYYPAYGGCYDDKNCHNNLWNNNYKPATDRWPMIITENFWFPEDNGLCKGSTNNYGNVLKANMDAAGNVSYVVGFLSDLLTDLSKSSPSNCNLSSKQGAQAAFEWFYGDNISGVTISSGTYALRAQHSGKAVDVAGGGTSNGTNIQQWTYSSTNRNQQFQISHLGNGWHRITPVIATGRCIDVSGISQNDGANIHIWDWLNQGNQKWKFVSTGDGYYYIISQHSGKCLDVSGVSTADGANIHLWTCHGGGNQKFSITQLKSTFSSMLKSNEEFSIYPSPASQYLTINIKCEENEIINVMIYNSVGELVLITNFKGTEGIIDLSRIPSGFYIIKADKNGKTYLGNFIKN